MSNEKISTQPYKGTRDFYPEDMKLRNWFFGKIRESLERSAFEEYNAPMLESLELYIAKSGEELAKEQTYNFTDRGGRMLAIRPEMTPSVARMVAAKAGELYFACDEQGKRLGAMKVSMRGFCGLYPYLGLIGVHADSRGLGVGKFLMDQLEAMAWESGARRVTLMVSDFNEGGQRFYQRLGYWKLGEIPDAAKAGITELVMVKDLT